MFISTGSADISCETDRYRSRRLCPEIIDSNLIRDPSVKGDERRFIGIFLDDSKRKEQFLLSHLSSNC